MAEQAFYKCENCFHTWMRTEWRTRPYQTPICPRCCSTEQLTDQLRQDDYDRQVYGPLTKHVGLLLNKKLEDPKE
jgi:hypothetical protein